MEAQKRTTTLPTEVSVGTPTDVPDTNDELMMTGDGDTGAAVAAATQQATEVTPRTDISSPPRTDTASANTSSHGSSSG